MNEAEFKSKFRADQNRGTDPDYPLISWTNTDAYRLGLPDFFISYRGQVVACEAKFVKGADRKRPKSKVLSHEVTPAQLSFLSSYTATGNRAVILIGIGADVAVYTDRFQENYTLEEVLAMPRVERRGKHWDTTFFLEDLFRDL